MAKANWEIYKDKAGEYRWRLKAANGRIVADSGEGYASKFNARIGILVTQEAAKSTEVTEI